MSQRRKIRNVYAIPLPDGRYAYGRQYKEPMLGISKFKSDEIVKNPDFSEIDFIVGVYQDVLTCGDWPIVCNYPFENEEEAWGVPTYIQDMLKPDRFEIYYKGKIRKTTKKECIGLERCAVWDSNHIIDRIMGIDTWNDICK